MLQIVWNKFEKLIEFLWLYTFYNQELILRFSKLWITFTTHSFPKFTVCQTLNICFFRNTFSLTQILELAMIVSYYFIAISWISIILYCFSPDFIYSLLEIPTCRNLSTQNQIVFEYISTFFLKDFTKIRRVKCTDQYWKCFFITNQIKVKILSFF